MFLKLQILTVLFCCSSDTSSDDDSSGEEDSYEESENKVLHDNDLIFDAYEHSNSMCNCVLKNFFLILVASFVLIHRYGFSIF